MAGSSPLARGLPVVDIKVVVDPRIIPARAGFTIMDYLLKHDVADHPRSRGVYMQMYEEAANVEGSSPLARGLPRLLHLSDNVARIIPARAGFTAWAAPSTISSTDHPRSRGVYPDGFLERDFCLGSSPLARGLPIKVCEPLRIRGIIPARAGFTLR